MSFTNRVIAITGAASGIGLATAHLLASYNATLALADLNISALASVSKDLQSKCPSIKVHVFELDVRSETSVQSWVEAIMKQYGRLDGAANLAGVIGPSIGLKGIAQQEISEWDFIVSVNLTGVMLCMKYQLQHITSPGGNIVNASSIAGLIGQPNNAAYTASKHGVLGLTRTAAKEVGKRGVRVNAVCPGYIDTPMNVQSRVTMEEAVKGDEEGLERVRARRKGAIEGVALGRGGKSEEVAELICFLLGEGSGFITGQSMSVDGGWYC